MAQAKSTALMAARRVCRDALPSRSYLRISASTRCNGADETWIRPSNGESMSTIR